MKKMYIMYKIIFLSFFIVFGFVSQGLVWGQQWRDAASQDLYGNWEGSVSINIPRDVENVLPSSSIDITVSFNYTSESPDIVSNMKIDLEKFLDDWVKLDEIRNIGLLKNDLWNIMSLEFIFMDDFSIGTDYTVNYDLSDTTENFFHDVIMQINDQGNRIKMIFNESISFDLGDEGFTEIILDKK